MRAEAAKNCAGGFDVVHGNGSAGNGFEQIAEEYGALVLGEFLEGGEFSGFGCADVCVEAANDFRRGGVEFRAFAEAVEAGVGEFGGGRLKSRCVHAGVIGEKIVESF